jgi:acyl dehydratase
MQEPHAFPEALTPARLTVDAALIAAYAELTQDFNPIHLDADFAASTPMGGVIAHGTMSIGLVWQSIERSLGTAALTEADLDIRFIKPVRLGEALVAGGQRRAGSPHAYEVWVRSEHDNSDRLVGSVLIEPAPSA